MRYNQELEQIFGEAVDDTLKRRSEYLTPESLLLSSLHYFTVSTFFKELECDIEALAYELDSYLENYVDKVSSRQKPEETAGFINMLKNSTASCLAAEKEFCTIFDLILAIYDDEALYASTLLRKKGIERIEMLETITKLEPFFYDGYYLAEGITEMEEESPSEDDSESFLGKYAVNINRQIEESSDQVLPVVGREEELDRTIQVLCRFKKNNPIHVGEAGVGKTSLIYGLASMICQDKVPEQLKGFTVYSLDMGSLLAGTKYRGDFEERFKKLINILQRKEKIIIYIDEIHQILGAGNVNGGSIDAASLLKPALVTGKLKVIGSTTYEEFNRVFEKDKALVRRFQRIDVPEPSRDEAIKMLESNKPYYEAHHKVSYSKDAVASCVDLSIQYMTDRRLPDKAFDLMDESGVYARLHSKKSDRKANVTVNTVRKVASKIAGVPVENVNTDEKEKLRSLESQLESRIFGQNQAVKAVCSAVKKARAGFRNMEKPEGIFLFVGPTGVGKTELTKVLSELLGEKLLRYDMSEYQEKHTVSRLIGSPPGYVGFEDGGLLTSDIRNNPHSVVLFDEIEKAHSDIYNILLQVMDYGFLTDNKGCKADFRNTIIIMTSNAGARDMEKGSVGFEVSVSKKNDDATLMAAVEQAFSPEFRNRLDAVIPFAHLSRDIINDIVRSEIGKIANRLLTKKITLSYSDDVVDFIASEGYSKEYGARNIARKAEELIASPLVDEVLFGKLSEGGNVEAFVKGDVIGFKY